MSMEALRAEYHRQLCEKIIRMQKDGLTHYPNFADKCSKASRGIAQGIVDRIRYQPDDRGLSGQTAGGLFESITRTFLRDGSEQVDTWAQVAPWERGRLALVFLDEGETPSFPGSHTEGK